MRAFVRLLVDVTVAPAVGFLVTLAGGPLWAAVGFGVVAYLVLETQRIILVKST